MKKIIAIATTLTVAVMVAGPGTAQAITAAELQAQIDALLAQLSALQSQLATLEGGTTGGGVAVSCAFTRNLYPEMSGTDVQCLQRYMNGSGFTLASSGAGSPGNETQYFGPLTQNAVQRWQDANGVAYGAYPGYFGPKSRAKYDELAAREIVSAPSPVCGNGTCESGETSASCPADCEAVAAVPSGLTVRLASDTPASATVADQANADFTKFTLSAGSEGDVKVSKIYVTRSGLTANSDLENIKIIDVETGEYKGSIGSLNVDNRAMITFVPNLVIEAGTTRTFFIRAGIVNNTTAGKTAALGIASNDDIVSDASTVDGAPVVGNAMTVVSLTIGTASAGEDGTTVDSQPEVGDTDVTMLKFKITAGSTEDITVETITGIKVGTADVADIENLELYSTTDSKSLGEISSYNSDERVTWSDLDIVIGKGKTHRFEIRADVVDGAESTAKTFNIDLVDGSDVLITVKGNTYGFYLTPSTLSSWNGKGSNSQTIESGALHISKSASTPATGNIAVGDEVPIAVFDFEAKGEQIKVTAITVTITAAALSSSDLTNVALYDENDEIVAGPKDTDSSLDADFTDTFIVPVGTHQYTVKLTLADSVSNGTTVLADIKTPGTTTVLTATGMTSNDSITATPAGDVAANTMTVAGAVLTVTTLGVPAGKSIPAGADDLIWATFSLDAGAAGEDIQVTSITVTDSVSAGTIYTDLDNAELWADLTDGNSGRGDVYETRISNTEQFTAATQAFTLSQTLTIPAGTFVKVVLVADLASGASDGTHTISLANSAATIVANGASTGTATTETYNVTNRQTMTKAGNGTLTVTKDSSTPVADIVIGNTTNVPIAVFRLAANNVEDLDLDHITLAVSNSDSYTNIHFYNGDTLLGSIPPSSSVTKYFADGTLTIEADKSELITIKADFAAVDGTTVQNGDQIQIASAGDVDATGLLSGNAVDSTAYPVSNAMKIYESRPYFSVNASSPSGNLFPSSNTQVAIFDIEAGPEDITFNSADSGSDGVLKIQVDATVSDTSATSLNYILVTLKDGDGNVLGYDSVGIGAAGSIDGGTLTFDTSQSWGGNTHAATNSFTIPANQTKQLYVIADTRDFEDDGDFIQFWLSDSADANINFAIDGSGEYEEGTKIFRNDIYAGSFVNPS